MGFLQKIGALYLAAMERVFVGSNDPHEIKKRRDVLTGGATTMVAAATSPNALLTEGVPNAFTPEEWLKLQNIQGEWEDLYARLFSLGRIVAPFQSLPRSQYLCPRDPKNKQLEAQGLVSSIEEKTQEMLSLLGDRELPVRAIKGVYGFVRQFGLNAEQTIALTTEKWTRQTIEEFFPISRIANQPEQIAMDASRQAEQFDL